MKVCVCVCVSQFLQDILDTLFSILDDNTDKYGPLVFQSLVSVAWAVHEEENKVNKQK